MIWLLDRTIISFYHRTLFFLFSSVEGPISTSGFIAAYTVFILRRLYYDCILLMNPSKRVRCNLGILILRQAELNV